MNNPTQIWLLLAQKLHNNITNLARPILKFEGPLPPPTLHTGLHIALVTNFRWRWMYKPIKVLISNPPSAHVWKMESKLESHAHTCLTGLLHLKCSSCCKHHYLTTNVTSKGTEKNKMTKVISISCSWPLADVHPYLMPSHVRSKEIARQGNLPIG
jgi:hypothetical protein